MQHLQQVQTLHLQHTCSSRHVCSMQPTRSLGTNKATRKTRRTSLRVQAHLQPEQVQQQQQYRQQHHHQQQQLQQQQQKAALPHSSRRGLFAAAGAAAAVPVALQLLQPPAASAYIVDETVAQSVFALAARSVVSINDYKQQGGAEIFEGVGTGFVWDKYGHVVTNYHVVSKYVLDKSGQQVVKVVLDDGSGGSQPYVARVVGTDAMHDLAVLQVDAPKDQLVPIRMGTSGDLKVGQAVYAVGNPYGLDKTLTAGVVSGLNRTIPAPTGTRIYGAIQSDASVNQGNSGGPMLDSFARLVGVNTASFTRANTGRGSGVNFALPADLVREIVPNLIVYGTAAGKGVRRG